MRASADSGRAFRPGLEPCGDRMGAGIAAARVIGPNLVTLKSRERTWANMAAAVFLVLFNLVGLPYPGIYDNFLMPSGSSSTGCSSGTRGPGPDSHVADYSTTKTTLPRWPPASKSSCARAASRSGRRAATTGLIFPALR